MNRPKEGSRWRLLFREDDLPAGSIGVVTDPCDEDGEVVLMFSNRVVTFNLDELNERCQQPAKEPSIGELAEAHEVLGHEAIELAHDIWCRDNHMDRSLAAQGSTRAMLLVAYPELRKRILAESIVEYRVRSKSAQIFHYNPAWGYDPPSTFEDAKEWADVMLKKRNIECVVERRVVLRRAWDVANGELS